MASTRNSALLWSKRDDRIRLHEMVRFRPYKKIQHGTEPQTRLETNGQSMSTSACVPRGTSSLGRDVVCPGSCAPTCFTASACSMRALHRTPRLSPTSLVTDAAATTHKTQSLNIFARGTILESWVTARYAAWPHSHTRTEGAITKTLRFTMSSAPSMNANSWEISPESLHFAWWLQTHQEADSCSPEVKPMDVTIAFPIRTDFSIHKSGATTINFTSWCTKKNLVRKMQQDCRRKTVWLPTRTSVSHFAERCAGTMVCTYNLSR